MFINPAEEDPQALIAFDDAGVPYAIGGDPRAEITITALGLDRPELNIRRQECRELLQSLRELIQINPDAPEAIQAVVNLRNRVLASAEYASMARVLLPEYL